MQNVMINNQIETIGSDRDIVDIIREHCGEDMASLIEYRLNVPLEENITPELIKECLQRTDYYAYESGLDDWNCVGNDVIEECNKQMEYMEESKRINKDILYKAFSDITKKINQIL